MKKRILAVMVTVLSLVGLASAEKAQNPTIWADVPDVSSIRVGDTYYMSSTTMHMSPGVPIMKSMDLVNWEMAGYAYDRLVENDQMNLLNGEDAYGKGTWASSLRYHKGTFYVSTFSATTGKTHVYSAKDVAGPWKASSFEPVLHDNSLFFDDDGRVYMVYGSGKITLVELLPDASGMKPGGVNKVIIENTNLLFGEDEVGGLGGEGSQLYKINGKYYLFNIGSPRSRWSRCVLLHRADNIEGPYEGRVALEDRYIAQGGLIDTPDGKWYATLFGDRGGVGRIPYLVPVQWEDGWPVLGVDGKVPDVLDIEDTKPGLQGVVGNDEFERKPGDPKLPLVWQWNHNPDNDHWEILQNPGRLRITTGRVDKNVQHARNTLTQRTFGPTSSATTCVDVSGMKDGDVAGLIALQNRYGYVGVKMVDGKKSIVMVRSELGIEVGEGKQSIVSMNRLSDLVKEVESVPLMQEQAYLKIDCDFRADKASFYYSLDGEEWTKIGDSLQMVYTFTKHFMGYRFGLFNQATETAGGYVDFHFYRISDQITDGRKPSH